MRVGVIGCGGRGSDHIRVLDELREVSDLTAIDPQRSRLDDIISDRPAIKARPSLRAALDDVDAVVIATPAASRYELALEAIEAGKHVLVEPPLARSSAEAVHLVEAADRAGVTLAVAHTVAHDDATTKLVSLVRAGEFGRLHRIDGTELGLGSYRDDMNVLWDRAGDQILLARTLVGHVPSTVAAWGFRHTSGFAEDVAMLQLGFAGRDVSATIRASWLDPDEVTRTTIVGAEKMGVLDDAVPPARVRIMDRGRRLRVRLGSDELQGITYRDGEIRIPYVPNRDPLKIQARRFLQACEPSGSPYVCGRRGLEVIAVLEAADRSLAKRGMPVAVEVPRPQAPPALAAA